MKSGTSALLGKVRGMKVRWSVGRSLEAGEKSLSLVFLLHFVKTICCLLTDSVMYVAYKQTNKQTSK